MTTPPKRSIAMTYTKVNQKQQPKDFTYWQTRHPSDRLAALEQIRQEYHQWKYDVQPRLQRVYRIVKPYLDEKSLIGRWGNSITHDLN